MIEQDILIQEGIDLLLTGMIIVFTFLILLIFSVNVLRVLLSPGIQNNGLSINKTKVDLDKTINADDLIHEKYILLQKGKKNYYLVHVV